MRWRIFGGKEDEKGATGGPPGPSARPKDPRELQKEREFRDRVRELV